MQQIQLYIQGEQVELFKDESVSITQSIQNVKDIAKIFTEFTRSFTVPASKKNNRIFKHYYNYNIQNGFDARTKKAANIELNYLPYLKGKIKLDTVELKNNKPHSYKITFFGNTVNLKDVLGKDTLTELDLSQYNQEYTASALKDSLSLDPTIFYSGSVTSLTSNRLNASFGSDVVAGTQVYNTTLNISSVVTFNAGTYLILEDNIFYNIGETYEVANHIITPLLTAKTRLYYDSSQSINDTGNLYWVNNTSYHGVPFRDLKYSLRLEKIIDAIETKYTIANGYANDIKFSDDFFSPTNNRWNSLFMWLHRKSGYVESGSSLQKNPSPVTGWNDESGTYDFNYVSNNILHKNTFGNLPFPSWQFAYCTDFNLTLESTSTDLFDVQIFRNGSIFYQQENINLSDTAGSLTIGLDTNATGTFELVILSTTDIVFTDIEWEVRFGVREGKPTNFYTDTFNTSDKGNFSALGTSFTFIVSNQIPEMPVLDFLTGVFKTFNLTTFVEDDGTIYVDTLDNFYADKKSQSTPYDISEFVNVDSSTVEPALPFKEVNLSFKDTKTYLATIHKQLFADVWGEERYIQVDDENIMVGSGVYKVESPFGHIKYERLLDQDDNIKTTVQYGWSVGESQDPYKGEPVIFYPYNVQIAKSGSNKSISYVDTVSLEGDNFQSKQEISGKINVPRNTIDNFGLNFGAEIDEYTGYTFTFNLFDKYYRDYITDIYNPESRLTKIKAYLPLRILLNFSLADEFVINDKIYKINSITTNLQTGESNMELLNVI